MFSLVSAPSIVMFILATFDPDETNSLLILKLFCAVSQEPNVFVKLLCGSEGQKMAVVMRSRCVFTSFCTFHCDVYTCYFDPDETNSLLILRLFCAVSQEPSVFVKLLCGSEGKKGPFLTVYVLQEWLLHIGLLVLSSLC